MYTFTKQELKSMDTIEQSWSGDELKLQEGNVKVWLTYPENTAYDGDYQVETRVNGVWHRFSFYFEQ